MSALLIVMLIWLVGALASFLLLLRHDYVFLVILRATSFFWYYAFLLLAWPCVLIVYAMSLGDQDDSDF